MNTEHDNLLQQPESKINTRGRENACEAVSGNTIQLSISTWVVSNQRSKDINLYSMNKRHGNDTNDGCRTQHTFTNIILYNKKLCWTSGLALPMPASLRL